MWVNAYRVFNKEVFVADSTLVRRPNWLLIPYASIHPLGDCINPVRPVDIHCAQERAGEF